MTLCKPQTLTILAATLFVCAAVLMAGAAGAGAQDKPESAKAAATKTLSATARRVERYLNSIATMRSRFIQIAPNGDISRGTVLLSRPGRLRIEYDPPVPILILTEGSWLMLYDKELEQPSYAPIDRSLAGFLVRPKIRLSDNEISHTVFEDKGVIVVSVTRRETPEEGRLSLVFNADPLRLRQWTVTDSRGDETRVALQDPAFNGKIAAKEFEFELPDRENFSD